jgi:hypothetical protein
MGHVVFAFTKYLFGKFCLCEPAFYVLKIAQKSYHRIVMFLSTFIPSPET